MRLLSFSLVFSMLCAANAGEPLLPASQEIFDKQVRPFLKANCYKCHSDTESLAGLRIDTLDSDFLAGKAADTWKEIYDRIGNGTMPPKDEPRPNAAEAIVVTDWIVAELRGAEKRAKGSSGRIPTRRLNRSEYVNTLRDLFHLDENIARALERELPTDGKVEGFDRGGAGLFVDAAQMALYLETADFILDREVFAPQPKITSSRSVVRDKISWHPLKYQGRYTDLPLWPIGHPQRNNENERVTVPLGANWAEIKRGGLEFIGTGYHGEGSIDFHGGTWHSWGSPWHGGDFADGWYRLKVRAGAFKGTGKYALDEVRLWFLYCGNTSLEVKQNVVIDAPLEEPREFEMRVFLRAGSPDIRKTLRLGWNGGPKKLIVQSPELVKLEKEFHHLYYSNDALLRKKPPATPEEIAESKKKLDDFALRHRESMLNDVKVAYVFDPEVDLTAIPRLWIEWLEMEGPITEWPPKGRTELFFDGEERTIDQAYLTEIFARFLPRAYRRPVERKEVDDVVAWVLNAQQVNQLSGVDAVREGVKMILCSPSFLLLLEPSDENEKPRQLTDPELACRLSYFLWSTMPDAELSRVAAENRLHEPAVLSAQVRRMLDDPKSAGLIHNFTGQWLKIRDFSSVVTDRQQYKAYDDELRDASWREPIEFFAHVLREDLSFLNFLDSDFLVINDRLAAHYGIEGVKGEAFRKVAIQREHRRGGVLGMCGVLTYGTDGLRTLPVRRAAYVLDTLWNSPPPPPPPNVGDLPPVGKVKTVRERLELHRQKASCASCHARIDPFGMALENYDAIGAWRDRQNGERFNNDKNAPVLDVSGVLPSGREFKDIHEFKSALMSEKDKFVHAFIEKMLTYALGRPVGVTDRGTIEEILSAIAPAGAPEKDKYRMRGLIQAIVASQVFQTK